MQRLKGRFLLLKKGDLELNTFSPRKFWRVVESSWPGTKVINQTDKFASEVRPVLTLCPLYTSKGQDLGDSALLPNPTDITESRVGGKWRASLGVLKRMRDYLVSVGGNLEVVLVFADKGVIVRNPTPEDEEALRQHEELYQERAKNDLGGLGIVYIFQSYSRLEIPYPTFIPFEEGGPTELGVLEREERVVEMVKRQLGRRNLSYSHQSRRVIHELVKRYGEILAVGLIASYLAFDQFIPMLGNMLISTERLDILFHLPRFDELGEQSKMPTVEISC